MRRSLLLAMALGILAACAAGSTGGSGAAKSGGAAGQMGQDYCHSVPSDPSERNRWNNLCFSRR